MGEKLIFFYKHWRLALKPFIVRRPPTCFAVNVHVTIKSKYNDRQTDFLGRIDTQDVLLVLRYFS